MESPVANRVTSHPRATSPSAILPATVSHAPYWRGGVRHATGDRIATVFPVLTSPLLHRGQHLVQRHGRATGRVIRIGVGKDELAPMHERAAGVNDVRHVAAPFVPIR